MALPPKFLHHLHELMVEVSDSLREGEAAYKAKLIWEAQRKNNGAAVLLAYQEAALHAYKTRIEATIDRYFTAISVWKLIITDSAERDLNAQFQRLLAAPSSLHFPPGITATTNVQPIQSSYARELQRTANSIQRKAANRLRELRVATEHNRSNPSQAALQHRSDTETTGFNEAAVENVPTAFVSYAWESDAHKVWVAELSTELRRNGVDVVLDQWNLPFGADRTLFMEQSIASSDFVLIIATPSYSEKGNKRAGGVGYEAMVITGELAAQTDTRKFIPILRSGDWDISTPRWLTTRLGADLRNDPYSAAEFNKLLQTLHKHDPAPPVGKRPVFASLPTNSSAPSKTSQLPPRVASQVQLEKSPGIREMELLWNLSRDPNGQLIHVETFDGEDISTNTKHFLVDASPRAIAEWRGALRKLEARGYIEPLSDERTFFELTDQGFAAADELEEFAHWRTHSVTFSVQYFNAPAEHATFQCRDVWALPTEYYEYSIRANEPLMRSVKVPRSLLIEGMSSQPKLSWEPTEIEFADINSGNIVSFRVEDLQLVKTSGAKVAIVG